MTLNNDFNTPGTEFLKSITPTEDLPTQTLDPITSDLRAINTIYENLFNSVNFVEIPSFSEKDFPLVTDPIKRAKLIEYITHTHQVLNLCFNKAIEILKVIATHNHQLSISEQDSDKKTELERSLNELRLILEIINSLLTHDGKMVFTEISDIFIEKEHLKYYVGNFKYKNNNYNIILNIDDYPHTKPNRRTGVIQQHLPRISFSIRTINNNGTTRPHSNFRFDLESSSGYKADPYNRSIVLDVTYPGQDETITYENIGQRYTYHFLIAEGIDFGEFHHICRVFRNNLRINTN